jgi:peptide deformylase
MAVLPIYNCYHPVLKKKTNPVAEFNQELKDFVNNLYETMYSADGVGLAANQVGEMQSIIVVDTSEASDEKDSHPPIVMINPIIISYSDEIIEYQEGCLSIPKFYEDVDRPKEIEVRYFDINMKEITIIADYLFSRVIQHEVDHLNGVLFYERLSSVRRALAKSKLRKIEKGDYETFYPMILPNGTYRDPSE